MFVITGIVDGKCVVLDTSDGVSESISLAELENTVINLGVNIGGVISKFGRVMVKCKSANALDEFVRGIQPALAQLSLMSKNVTSSDSVKAIEDLARVYGFVQSHDGFGIDLENHVVALKDMNLFLTYNDNGVCKVVDKVQIGLSKKKMGDQLITSEDIARVSGTRFDSLIMQVGGKDFTVQDFIDEFSKLSSVYNGKIAYLGVTPSNKIFKIVVKGIGVYSVKFGLSSELKTLKRTKTEKAIGFNYYVSKRLTELEDGSSPGNSLAVVKASEKSGYSSHNLQSTIIALKKKYPTLQDVYIREDV